MLLKMFSIISILPKNLQILQNMHFDKQIFLIIVLIQINFNNYTIQLILCVKYIDSYQLNYNLVSNL